MPVMSGFGALSGLLWERINNKIERRVLAGNQGMIVSASARADCLDAYWQDGFSHRERSAVDGRGRCCSDSRQRRARRILP